MFNVKRSNVTTAIYDYHQARRKAIVHDLVSRFTGSSAILLSYDEVRKLLKAQPDPRQTLKFIPIDAIVGSVNRYDDFTRNFLPRANIDPGRWASVMQATYQKNDVPPIEVYQIGEAYFVIDGNHRVSIARQLGEKHIQAYVTEVVTPVPLTPDIKPEELIIKAEYASFLINSNMANIRPEADLSVTVPGQYKKLEEHIAVHRYYMGLEKKSHIPYEEAVAHWYDTVYVPIVCIFHQQGLLDDFPDRTETDLYIWLSEHRTTLAEQIGGNVDPERASKHLAYQFSPRLRRIVKRIGTKALDLIIPDSIEPGHIPGEWRKGINPSDGNQHLFKSLLVAISKHPDTWSALDQAILIAQREDAELRGVHIVTSKQDIETEYSIQIQDEFLIRCQRAGIQSRLLVVHGDVTRKINELAGWNDLVVLKISYPPANQPVLRLRSGLRELVQRSPRPILTVPGEVSKLTHALLAYDGSPKSREALYLAAYMAGNWQIKLSVISVLEGKHVTPHMIDEAQTYLDKLGISADYIVKNGSISSAILITADDYDCDFIILGGYGQHALINVLVDKVADQVMRKTGLPMFISQ